MSTLPVKNLKGETVGEVALAADLLNPEASLQVVRDAVVAHRANVRAGSASTKGKGAVAGTGKKPWRQKGTGRARAGYARSPVWRGGGVAHGPHPRDFGWALPKKAARLAFRRALAGRIADGAVSVIEALELAEPKTRLLRDTLRGLGAETGVLLVVDRPTRALTLAARNLSGVEVAPASDVHTYSLLRWPRIVVTRAAWTGLEERLAKGRPSA
jgi:large subunit ribosomal protein L4